MPLVRTLIKLAASPQGRTVIGHARRIAADPKQRERLEAVKVAVAKHRESRS